MTAPLAIRIRPKDLDGFVGQKHMLGDGCRLRLMIEQDKIRSLILFGPSGTGKTTLARIIANRTKSEFYELNATTSGIAEVRKLINGADVRLAKKDKKTIVFLDECLPHNSLIICRIENKIRIIPIGKVVEKHIECDILSYNNVLEWKPIISWTKTEPKEMLEIEIETEIEGLKKFRCSPNHLIYTKNRGYIEAQNLDASDNIMYLGKNRLKEIHDGNKTLQDM